MCETWNKVLAATASSTKLKLESKHWETLISNYGLIQNVFLTINSFFRSEDIEDAWMALFGHIARVMAHGHTFFFQKEIEEEK